MISTCIASAFVASAAYACRFARAAASPRLARKRRPRGEARPQRPSNDTPQLCHPLAAAAFQGSQRQQPALPGRAQPCCYSGLATACFTRPWLFIAQAITRAARSTRPLPLTRSRRVRRQGSQSRRILASRRHRLVEILPECPTNSCCLQDARSVLCVCPLNAGSSPRRQALKHRLLRAALPARNHGPFWRTNRTCARKTLHCGRLLPESDSSGPCPLIRKRTPNTFLGDSAELCVSGAPVPVVNLLRAFLLRRASSSRSSTSGTVDNDRQARPCLRCCKRPRRRGSFDGELSLSPWRRARRRGHQANACRTRGGHMPRRRESTTALAAALRRLCLTRASDAGILLALALQSSLRHGHHDRVASASRIQRGPVQILRQAPELPGGNCCSLHLRPRIILIGFLTRGIVHGGLPSQEPGR